MKVLARAIVGVCVVAALAGCQSSQYRDLEAAYRATEARNQELESSVTGLEREVETLRGRLGESDTALGRSTSANAQLREDLLRLRTDYRGLEGRLQNLDFSTLDPETDAALRQFAAANSDIVTYDSRQGMLRFASDLTFALGSTEVRDGARQQLQALARVLNSASAGDYDVKIVGHTDSVPISRSRDRHPTNLHLSAHRAISVSDVLAAAGIDRTRLQVAGWGEYRPQVANRPGSQGTPENRRVEIYLLPSTRSSATPAPSSGAAAPQREDTDFVK